MIFYIKNMVSTRCKMIVKAVLENAGLHCIYVRLGEAEIREVISKTKLTEIKEGLLVYGLDLMEDKRSILIEKIKTIIIEMIHYSEEPPIIKFSIYLGQKLNYDYNYLSTIFSKETGTTIEHFIIMHKIERVKEMLVYAEYSLSEIAGRLHFCSVQHLTFQFKQITGLRPSEFRKMKQKKLIALDNL
jgi:AraC-like DNA-binding protein